MTDSGLLPPVNDIIAAVVVVTTYLMRFAFIGDPTQTAPVWLVVTSDFIIPTMAAAYLFVIAMFIAIDHYDGR